MSHSTKRGKNGQSFSPPWKQLFFEMFVSIDLLGPKKKILSIAQSLSKYPVDPLKCSIRIVTLDNTRKNRPKNFPHWKYWQFFQKFVFSTTSQVLKHRSYMFHSNRHNALWTLITCPLRFVTLDNTRKKGSKSFATVKTAIFWNVCFYRPLRSQKKDLIKCTKFVKNPVDP